jgi:hypothetical protein
MHLERWQQIRVIIIDLLPSHHSVIVESFREYCPEVLPNLNSAKAEIQESLLE